MDTLKEDFKQELLSLFTNEEFVKTLSECKNSEECYNTAKPYISNDISFEEFRKSMKYFHDNMVDKDGYLNLEDLDDVAGGTSDDFELGKSVGKFVVVVALAAAL